MRLMLLMAALVAVFSLPAYGRQPCMTEAAMRLHLAAKYQEEPVAGGLSSRGAMVRVFVGPGGSWSIVITNPQGMSCLVDAGEAWREVDPAAQDPRT